MAKTQKFQEKSTFFKNVTADVTLFSQNVTLVKALNGIPIFP
ncbi:hypothetical protein [Mucilaginibacter daejeonensis]|nr:hypothetical protein [Mucilaginibacter daejeonensis]